MLPGELRWILLQQIVGKALKDAKKLFLVFLNASATDEILPKPRTFEDLVAAILLFELSRCISRAQMDIGWLYTSIFIGLSASNQSNLLYYCRY